MPNAICAAKLLGCICMQQIRNLVVICFLVLLGGCFSTGLKENWNLAVGSTDHGKLPENLPGMPPSPRASTSTNGEAIRVAKIGHEILEKNPGLGIHPIFQTSGEAGLVLGHKGARLLVVSESGGKRCTDGELASLLSEELARMVVEQESMTTRGVTTGSWQPLGSGIDRDGGAFGPADGTMLAERAVIARQSRGVTSALDSSYGFKGNDSARLGEEILKRSGFRAEDPAKVRELRRQSGRPFSPKAA